MVQLYLVKDYLLLLFLSSFCSAQHLVTTEMVVYQGSPAARLYWSNGAISMAMLNPNAPPTCTPCEAKDLADENVPSISGTIQTLERKNGECQLFLLWTFPPLWVCIPIKPCEIKTKIEITHNGTGPAVYISKGGELIGTVDAVNRTWSDVVIFKDVCGAQKNTEYDLFEGGKEYYLTLIQLCGVCWTTYPPD